MAAALLVLGRQSAGAHPMNMLGPGWSPTGPAASSNTSDVGTLNETAVDQGCLDLINRQSPSSPIDVKWQLDELLWDFTRLPWPRLPLEFHVTCTAPTESTFSGGGGAPYSGPVGGWSVGIGGSGGFNNPFDTASRTIFFAADSDAVLGDDFFSAIEDGFPNGPLPFGDTGLGGDGLPFGLEFSGLGKQPGDGEDRPPGGRLSTFSDGQPTPVPEPATLWLTAAGLAAGWRYRTKNKT